MASRYFTFRPGRAPKGRLADALTLKPGQTLGFAAGHGYYAKPKPAAQPAGAGSMGLLDLPSQLAGASVGSPPTAASPALSSVPGLASASALAKALMQPQIDALTKASEQRAQSGTNAIQGYTTSLAHALSQHDYTAPYTSAIQDQAAVDQALREAITGAGSSAASDLQSRLQHGGIDPAQVQAAVGAVNQNAQGSAGATVGLGSAVLGQLVSNRASADEYGQKLPGIAGLSGLQDLQQFQGQVTSDLQDKLASLAAQEPTLAYSIYQDQQQRADKQAEDKAAQTAENEKIDPTLSAAFGYAVNQYGEQVGDKQVPYTPYEKPSSSAPRVVKGAGQYYTIGPDGTVTPTGIETPATSGGKTHLQLKNVNGHTFTFDPATGATYVPGTTQPVDPNSFKKPAKVSTKDLRDARAFLFQNRNGYWALKSDPETPLSSDALRVAQAADRKAVANWQKNGGVDPNTGKNVPKPQPTVIKTGVAPDEGDEIQRLYVTLVRQYGVPARRAFQMVAGAYKQWGKQHADYFSGKADAAAETAALYVLPGNHEGMVAQGNVDLAHRPTVRNKDGSVSTVRSITIGPDDGRYILIPTVVGNKVVSNQAAIAHYKKTGENLGVFNSEAAADRYAVALHEQQAKMYLPKRGLEAAYSREGAGGVYRPAWNKTLTSQQRQQVARQALAVGLGVPYATDANVRALVGRMNQESGGQTAVVNKWDSNWQKGTPSIGLLQTIPSTFQKYALPGHTNIWDPVDNTIAAVRYMLANYGRIVGPSGEGY